MVVHGFMEVPWETDEQCRERFAIILSSLVMRNTQEEKMTIAKAIPIKNISRIGVYNPFCIRPTCIEFECKGDVEYLLEHKRSLPKGIYVDREYGEETEKNRKLLRPIFNLARKHPDYKNKCRMDGDVLVIKGMCYTVDNLHSLPEEINGASASSKSNETTMAFFGELNLLSNFYKCEFEYTGINFHSSEQMIQYMKAIFFEDTVSATSILNCETALECKRASAYIKGYSNKTWSKCAQEMCEGGIFQKFKQNPELATNIWKEINRSKSRLYLGKWDAIK